MARALVPVTITTTFEAEFSAGVWTDITDDVRLEPPPRWDWGIQGDGVLDLVASPGTIEIGLDNSANNSGGASGYYSPDHASVRSSGFDIGMGLRVKQVYGGVTRYKKYYVLSIEPTADTFGEQVTYVRGVDWMEYGAGHRLTDVAVVTDAASDAVFQAIVDALSIAPENTSKDTGTLTYLFALDQVKADRETALSAFQKLAQSGLDRVYLTRDATDGETLVFENHSTRLENTAAAETFDNDSSGSFRAKRTLDRIINVVDVGIPSRRVDEDATTVLATLDDDDVPVIGIGETVTLYLDYRDPANEAQSMSGVDEVDPVATTDYLGNAKSDGSGADLTADLSVVATFLSTQVKLVITNGTSPSQNIYLTHLQVRGKGLYSYKEKHARAEDSSSITAYGERFQSVRMPWQHSESVAQEVANLIRDLRADIVTGAPEWSYWATRHDELADAALALDVGSRIGIDEDLTGISDADGSGWWINRVSNEWVEKTALFVTYGLEYAPVSPDYFTLGSSALNGSDILVPF